MKSVRIGSPAIDLGGGLRVVILPGAVDDHVRAESVRSLLGMDGTPLSECRFPAPFMTPDYRSDWFGYGCPWQSTRILDMRGRPAYNKAGAFRRSVLRDAKRQVRADLAKLGLKPEFVGW